MNSLSIWLLGIAAAFISGGASGVVAGVTATGIDPGAFNWTTQLRHTFILMGLVFVISGALGVAAYLKASPLPRAAWTPQKRAERTGKSIPAPPVRVVWTAENVQNGWKDLRLPRNQQTRITQEPPSPAAFSFHPTQRSKLWWADRPLSAFLRRHRKESGGLLMHMVTAAFRALDLVLFVFRKSEDDFKGLLAIFAEKFVSRHDDPQSNSTNSFYSAEAQHGGEEMTRQRQVSVRQPETSSRQKAGDITAILPAEE